MLSPVQLCKQCRPPRRPKNFRHIRVSIDQATENILPRPLEPPYSSNDRETTYISLRINFHFWHCIVELHVSLSNVSAILYDFDTLPQLVASNGASFHRGLRDESNRRTGNESLKAKHIV